MSEYTSTLGTKELFSKIDIYFADFIERQGAKENTVLAAAFLSRAIQQGEICFSPAQISHKDKRLIEEEGVTLPDALPWIEELKGDKTVVGEAGAQKPIIIENNALFFQRYFEYYHSHVNWQKENA